MFVRTLLHGTKRNSLHFKLSWMSSSNIRTQRAYLLETKFSQEVGEAEDVRWTRS